MNIFRNIKHCIEAGGVDSGEAQAMAFILMEDIEGIDRTGVLMGKEPEDAERLMNAARRVAGGEPVQYVTGKAWFCGMSFSVCKDVLIPRAETEELVNGIVDEVSARSLRGEGVRMLDIGTGSGCIAVSLKRRLPAAEVVALDVSADALSVAEVNARANGAEVRFVQSDILTDGIEGIYDVVVSNPPYICGSEAAEMEANVLEHEPHLALFVSDDDPLVFYRRIAELAREALNGGGLLAFEINRRFGREVVDMLAAMGYRDVRLIMDQFGNDRMVKAIK